MTLTAHAPVSDDATPPDHPWRGRVGRALAATVLGLLGGGLGLMLGGTVHHEIGPLATSMQVTPVWGGGTTVDVPPLGTLELDTHGGPLGIRAQLDGVDVDEARTLLQNPDRLTTLGEEAERDLVWEVQMAALRSLVAALVGGGALSLLALRRIRWGLAGSGAAAVAMVASGSVAVATWNPTALAEPRYTGLLTSAPTVVGDAGAIVDDYRKYGDQLARIVENVTGLYAASTNLPIVPSDQESVRVLHVSDLHLAPHAWQVIRTVARNYRVDMIVDSGDITDHGSAPENRYLEPIGTLGVPYVWVRGNHDSAETEKAMRALPNTVVLDGKVRRVAGLSILGAGDPTFTPDKSARYAEESLEDRIAGTAEELAATAEAAGGVDLMVYHDPTPIAAFDGSAGIALAGHLHYRRVRQSEAGTWRMVQGSTGGSGLRALEPEEPAKIQMSVLHLDRESGDLLAYDDIRLGGLGLASAEIDRQVVAGGGDDAHSDLVAPGQNAAGEPSAGPTDGSDEPPSDAPSGSPGDRPSAR